MIEYSAANVDTDRSTIEGFVRVYQEAFGGAPYFESYPTEEILADIWQPHMDDGIVVLAADASHVVGFGCAVPLSKAPSDIQEHIGGANEKGVADIDHERSWYMSELGVLETFRGNGIGYNLVKHRLRIIKEKAGGDTQYVFRTAAEESNSIHLYKKIGAQLIPRSQDISESDQVTVNGSQSTSRVYLFGDCEVALSLIPT